VHEDNTLEITGVDEIPRVKDYNIEVNENGNKSEDTGEIEMTENNETNITQALQDISEIAKNNPLGYMTMTYVT